MPAPLPTTNPRTMSFDSQLIEDFLHTQEILVDGKCAPPLAVFQNAQGESEALVISRNSLGNDELYHVAREPLSDSGWNICGLGAHPMAIAVADSQMLWAVGTDRQFWQNQAGRWSQTVAPLPDGAYVPEPSISGSPAYVPLALGNDGIVRAVDSQGRLYAYDPTQNAPQGQWNLVACPYPLATAPVGGGDSFWAISNSQIVQYSAGTWQISDFPGEMVQQVCVGTDGSVWALDTQGNLYQWTNQQWQQISTAPQLLMLSVVTADQMWGISFNSPIAIWTGNGQTWALDSQAPPIGAIGMTGPQPQISTAADGTVWCIDSSGMPWRCISRRGPQWQRLMLPTGMSGFTATEGVAAVVVGKDQKALQAFYVRGEKLYQAQANPLGTWREFQRLGAGGTSLGITHQQDTGEMFVYGIDSKGNLITSRESNNYALYTFNAYGTLAGASVQINALSHEAWFTAAVMDGQLYVQWGSADNPLASGPCPGQMMSVTRSVQGGAAPSNLASLVPMPWLQTPVGFYCCVLDNTGNLSMVFDLSYVESSSDDCVGYGSFVPLTGQSAVIPSPVSAVTCAGALIDDSGMTRIYATDSNYQLWVLRQTGSTNNPQDPNPWSWTFWHPLGNNCTALCNGPGTNRTRELFVLDADSFLNLCSQETVSRSWQTALVRQPTGAHETPYYVAQYVTEITVYNESGNPEPNVLVTVSVAEPVSIWVSGKQYLLDATHSQPFNTNAMGKITFSTLALGLHTAELTLQAPGFAAPYTVYPPQNIHQQLAQVDAPTLTAAKARTQSVPSVVQSPLVDSQHQTYCAASATVMQDAFKIQQKHNIQPGAPGPVSPGTVLSVIPPSCPATGPWSDPGSWDSFWRDLAHFGEDIWHGIRNGILALENVAVDFEEGAIKLTVALEGLGAAVIKFVVKTIQDVVSAVSSAFRYLGAKIEQAIDWLKEFFDWGDILNTKRVMEYYLNEVLGNLVNNLDPNSPSYIQPLIEAQFEALIKLVVGDKQDSGTGVFSRAKQTFGTTTFNGTVAQTPVDPKVGSQGLQPTGTQNTFQAHQVKSSYARTKSETHIHQGGRVTPSGGGAACAALDAGALDDFFTLVTSLLKSNEQGSPYSQARAQLQANLKSLKHPRDLFSTALNDFLAMMKELVEIVIKIIEDVLLALLKIAGAGLAGFQELLNYPLHIPVISWLYQQISDHPLTLLDLFCLIMAIPATLIYKLIWGGDQASPPFTSAQVQRITSRGIVWPQIQGTQIGMSATPLSQLDAAEASALSIVLGILSLVNGLAYGFIDFATDVDTLGGGEVDISTFLSGAALVLSLTGFGFGVPYTVFEKDSNDWTPGDTICVAVWGWSTPSLLLNLATFLSTKYKQRLAKYLTVGPDTVAAIGLIQLAVGIAAATIYSDPDSGYNGFNSAGGIITPIPSIGKLLLLPKNEALMLILGPLDLICDFGSGLCSFAGDI